MQGHRRVASLGVTCQENLAVKADAVAGAKVSSGPEHIHAGGRFTPRVEVGVQTRAGAHAEQIRRHADVTDRGKRQAGNGVLG